ncbi:MAG: hypothetical protein K6E51_01810 [Treponema sp.]|nr:hypothetical protein [Treponema sp.]
MDNEKIKQILLEIQDVDLDFTVTLTGKESKKVNGLYKPDTREILLHNKNFKTDNELIYTAIHEYTHHLINTEQLALTGGKVIKMYNAKVHTQAFWNRFRALLETAEAKGFYTLNLTASPELADLTEKIKKEYLETNGKLMQEFGKLLAKAHALCEQANIRYEDYLDRILCLPRNSAKEITKVAVIPVNPAVGFENMKKLTALKKPEDRTAAEQEILAGKNPDSVLSLMKKKAAPEADPKTKLEKERDRLSKTIAQLTQRLELVEESLASM